MEPEVKVHIETVEGPILEGLIPQSLALRLVSNKDGMLHQRFILVPEGGDPLTIKGFWYEPAICLN